MRILQVHNHYKISAGEDTVFYAEAALLENHGHTVAKFTLSNEDVNSVTEKLGAALGVVYNTKSARMLKDKINEFQPDIIHVHNFFPLISPAVFDVAHKLGVPVVMTLHNYRLICPSAYLHYNGRTHMENVHKAFPLQAILDKAYRNSMFQTASVVLATGVHKLLGTWQHKVDRFITLTQGGSDLFFNSSLKPTREQLVVKPNFTADLGLSVAERGDHFLFVGRLSPEKGIGTLLKATELYPFKLKIIGDGSMREEVERHAANYPNVEYLGYQKLNRVEQELKTAKALIFPSEWMETFGMTIIEAFSTGTPAIAAKIGGAEQLVEDGINGLHYTPGQPAELAEKVRMLLHDQDLAQRLGIAARQRYETQYTPEANYRMLVSIYEDVIRSKKKKAPATEVAEANLS
ncbi:glycosyltransferase family 4 protein [Pontibacter sp. HSC-36F09]|uniref:glycosyltransferase family 4 protein n=1 Tax=Pontibacter sp. HSC-36F09 TaxID=2910966 RepID=UPI00209CEBE9|nr:glycosyltransferase family 4 protein [Pontibacter sp. HSC-36F09]MCP2044804.1 glycosyltransferase involved in cell wall biosynthesis [Pontibacter sp. HSC-36F09]